MSYAFCIVYIWHKETQQGQNMDTFRRRYFLYEVNGSVELSFAGTINHIYPYNITALYFFSWDPFGHCLLMGAISVALQEAIKCYISTIRSQSKLSGLYQ